MKNNNELFKERNVYSEDMYVKGIYPAAVTETEGFVTKEEADTSEKMSIVAPLRFGSIYVVRFPQKTELLRAAVVSADPRKLAVGGALRYESRQNLAFFEGDPSSCEDFMYVPNKEGEYLVICTGKDEKTPVYIGENPMLLGHDTDDEWYHAPAQKDLMGNVDSWGNWQWTSDEVLKNVYEPMRLAHPDYITRRTIGKDMTNKYDMWAYFFEPADYEQVLFITGGMHAAEMDGYLGLARFMELMVSEDGSNAGLHYLRTKVKIVLIPIVNVFSASEGHNRTNALGVDLNRDFKDHSQSETINVLWLYHQFKDEVAAVIDYHTSKSTELDLYYQFSIQAANAPVCLKVTNHIYEDLKARGLAAVPTNLSYMPGKYNKSDAFLQGYMYNHFNVPTLVAEHEHLRYYPMHSAENLQLAVDYYGNFMIQTALAKLKLIK